MRVAALRSLSWRLPDPRDDGRATSGSPFRFYSTEARRRDVAAAWAESLRPALRAALTAALASDAGEAALGAYSLGALGEIKSVHLLFAAADRLSGEAPIDERRRAAVYQVAAAAYVLAQLGAAPPAVDARSTPGRLAVWANMVRARPERRPADWQEVLLLMLRLEEPVTRMAAVRALPEDFSRAAEIPWRELLLEADFQIWWHALRAAERLGAPRLDAIARQILERTQDEVKRNDLRELLRRLGE